jgi:hypothetical protein
VLFKRELLKEDGYSLYVCKIWLLPQREEYRLRVFENEVLGIFGCKRKVTGGWRKL